LLHLFHSFVSALLQLIDWIEYLFLVSLVQALLVLLDLFKYFILVSLHFFIKLLHLFLEFSILTHSDVVVHLEIALLVVVINHVGSECTAWFISDVSIIFYYSLILSLQFPFYFLNLFTPIQLILRGFFFYALLNFDFHSLEVLLINIL